MTAKTLKKMMGGSGSLTYRLYVVVSRPEKLFILAARAAFVLSIMLFFCGFTEAGPAQSSFKNFFRKVENTYILPTGSDTASIEQRRPDILALILGDALGQQGWYVQRNPALRADFDRLQAEVRAYLERVARITQWRPTHDDGTPLGQAFWEIAQTAMDGGYGDMLPRKLGFKPRPMPPVLTAIIEHPPDPPPPSGKLYEIKPTAPPMPGTIDLMDQKVSSKPNEAIKYDNMGIDQWNAGSKAYHAGNKEAARQHYKNAREYWKKACDLGCEDSCSSLQGGKEWGKYYRKWGEK